MAYRKKYTRNKKRTYRRKRARTYKKRRTISRNLGLGFSHVAKLRYVNEFSIDAPAAGIASIVMRANDLYQPASSGATHQPYGFDNLTAMFDRWTVIGSKIKVQWHTKTTSSVAPAHTGILLSDNGTTASSSANVNHLLESYLTSSVLPVGLVGAPNNSTTEIKMFKNFSAKRFFKNKSVSNQQFQGSSTASPDERAYFEIFAAAMDSNNPGVLYGLITIDYVAVFTEPKRVLQS